jgi:hypothetical protein
VSDLSRTPGAAQRPMQDMQPTKAGLESGVHTHMFVENGLWAKLKLEKGGLLTVDAGSLGYALTFDENDNVTDLEPLWVHGPHPAFDSPVWCEAAIDALGLQHLS